MSALAKSQVSLYPTSISAGEISFGGQVDKALLTRRVKLTSVSVGGQTNTLGAAALGFSELVDCGNFFDDTNNKVVPAVVDPVTNTIVFGAGAFSGGAAAGDVSSVTGYITVVGVPTLVPTA